MARPFSRAFATGCGICVRRSFGGLVNSAVARRPSSVIRRLSSVVRRPSCGLTLSSPRPDSNHIALTASLSEAVSLHDAALGAVNVQLVRCKLADKRLGSSAERAEVLRGPHLSRGMDACLGSLAVWAGLHKHGAARCCKKGARKY